LPSASYGVEDEYPSASQPPRLELARELGNDVPPPRRGRPLKGPRKRVEDDVAAYPVA
jgi:hypothetical protein